MAFQDTGIRLVVLGTSTFQRDVNSANRAMNDLGKAAGNTSTRLNSLGSAVTRVGQVWTSAITVPVVALGGALIATGIQFEDAFAGIGKTVDGVSDKFGELTPLGEKLQMQIRKLALEIPISASELARLGEQAGALGIEADQLKEFVKTVAELGVATNLSAEDAGNAIAKIGNIMGIQADQMGLFAKQAGSAIVDLGNKSAAEESDIVNMAYRIAGAGKAIGLTTQEIFALSTSVSELGINAEAGGTAVSRVLLEMQSSATEGGDKLALFAKAAGVTVEEFKNLVKNSPINAFKQVAGGLASMQEEGVLTSDTLAELGLNSIRLRSVINNFGPDMGKLTANIGYANTAWKEASALQTEADKKFATTKNQLILLRNNFSELGITLFYLYRGPIRALIASVKAIVKGIDALNASSLRYIVQVAAIVAAIGPMLVVLGQAIKLFGILKSSASIALTFLGGISTPVILITAAVVALGIAWKKNFLGIQDFTKNAFKSVTGTASNVIKELQNIAFWVGKAFSWGSGGPRGNIFTGIAAAFRSLTYIYEDNKTTFFSNVLQAFGLGEEKAQQLGMVIRNILTPALLFMNNIFNVAGTLWNSFSYWAGIIITDFLRFTGVLDILRNAFVAFFSGDFDFAFASLQLAWDHVVMWYNTEGKTLILAALTEILGIIIRFADANVMPLVNTLVKWGKAFVQWIIDIAPDVLKKLGDLIGDIVEWIGKVAPDVANKLLDWAQEFVDWIIDIAPDVLRELGGLITDIVGWLGDQVIVLWEKLLLWGAAFIDWLGPVIRDILPKLGELIGTILGRLVYFLYIELPPKLAEMAAAFISWVVKAAKDIGPELLNFLRSVQNFITLNLIPGFISAAKGLGVGFINGIKAGIGDNWNSVVDFITSQIRQIPGVGNFLLDQLGLRSTGGSVSAPSNVYGFAGRYQLAQYAGGGSLDRPSIVGERGPELFVPGQSGYIINNQLTKLLGSVLSTVALNKPTTQGSMVSNRSFAPTIYGAPIQDQEQLTGDLDRMYRMATLANY